MRKKNGIKVYAFEIVGLNLVCLFGILPIAGLVATSTGSDALGIVIVLLGVGFANWAWITV